MTAAAALLALAVAAGPPVRVGSKKFTESVLLGDLATGLLAGSGIAAEHRSALGGTRILWSALRRGDVDLYPEYTGTAWRELLGRSGPVDGAALERELAALGVAATRSLGFEDTYAIALRRDRAAALGVRRISDLAAHPALRLGFTNEFLDRADGWPALRDRYGLPQPAVRGLDHDVAYRALAEGRIDATDAYSTDPEIPQRDLVLLEDDRHAFPEYAAVLLYRRDLQARAPGAVAALRRLEGRLPVAEMRRLDGAVQLAGRPSAEVAAEFLRQALGVAWAPARAGLARRLLQRTGEHLALVAAALLGAVALAIPLGVASARHRRLGRLALGAAGVIQTIPSLALLVFMIPLLGIGARPAVAALFLYGLLPIVRNTHAGLTGIAPELRESAAAIGLPRAARLWRVELPLALPSILAGVKTSAVITVGTATLGALIGAGGYGQPILTGLRLDSVPLILEGAVPAALLALAVEAAFELLERALVSPGLRPGA